MRLSPPAIKLLARLRDGAEIRPRRQAGANELIEAGLIADEGGRWTITEAGTTFPADEVASFGHALDEVADDEVALERARRSRNNAAARLAGKLSLSEIGEIAGVSKQRVAQWAAEAEEEK